MRILLAAILLFFPQFMAACPSAAELSDGGSIPGSALGDCRELGQFYIPTGRENVSVTMFGTRESDEDYILDILAGLTLSGDALSRLGPVTTKPIEVFISPTTFETGDAVFDDQGAEASASRSRVPRNGSDVCIIIVFPELFSDRYQFTLAHEFFHCVQYNEASAQMNAPRHSWWSEGTAEWFASFVYQGTDYSDGFVYDFDLESSDLPITQMSYGNVVFFSWYANSFGNSSIIDFIKSMSPEGDHNEALARLLSDEEFLAFAKDYFDQKIEQPGGRYIPVNPTFDNQVRWVNGGEHDLTAPRFMLFRLWMIFSCAEWEVETMNLNGIARMKRMPGEVWEDVPSYVSSDDGEDVNYHFIGVGTGPEGFTITLDAQKIACGRCDVPNYDEEPEACLLGEWRLVSGGLGEKIGEMLQGGNLENVDYPDLDNILTFNADGTYITRTEDDGHLESVKPSGDRIIGDVELDFERSGTWNINGENLNQCSVPPTIHINLDAFDTSTEETSNFTASEFLGPQLEIRTSRKFTCDDSTLTMTEGGFFAPRIEWVYAK